MNYDTTDHPLFDPPIWSEKEYCNCCSRELGPDPIVIKGVAYCDPCGGDLMNCAWTTENL